MKVYYSSLVSFLVVFHALGDVNAMEPSHSSVEETTSIDTVNESVHSKSATNLVNLPKKDYEINDCKVMEKGLYVISALPHSEESSPRFLSYRGFGGAKNWPWYALPLLPFKFIAAYAAHFLNLWIPGWAIPPYFLQLLPLVRVPQNAHTLELTRKQQTLWEIYHVHEANREK
jgi:hypothetical protein